MRGAPVQQLRGRWRFGWLWGTIWLIYLGYPLQDAWRHEPGLVRVIGLAAIVAFGACYTSIFVVVRSLRRRGRDIPAIYRWGMLAALIALTALAAPAAGESSLGMFVYMAATAIFVLSLRAAVVWVLALIVAAEVASRLVPGWKPQDFLAFQIFISALAVWGFLQLVQRNAQLVAAQRELSALAVVEERNRLARDLHDLLGHSLTVVAVKAELAGRLLEVNAGRAASEIADVERLARQALAGVRATMAGYREGTLAGELASAHAALTAAGIEAESETDAIDDIPAERQQLFGWVVREGVINVVRHSGAKRCRIRVTPDAVEVTDDGRGPGLGLGRDPVLGAALVAVPGHGLAGLRERADSIGARLTIGRTPEGGFALRVAR